MFSDDILALLRAKPFVPFAIHTSERGYHVNHPDQVLVTFGAAYVGVPRNRAEDGPYNVVILNNQHISRIEPVATASATQE